MSTYWTGLHRARNRSKISYSDKPVWPVIFRQTTGLDRNKNLFCIRSVFFEISIFLFSPAADKPLPASPTSPTSPPPIYSSQSQLASPFRSGNQRQLMKLDRCRSAENMTQLQKTRSLVNAAPNLKRENDENNLMNPIFKSSEVLKDEDEFGRNVTQRKNSRTNSEEENNSTPNSSRRGSSIADKIR